VKVLALVNKMMSWFGRNDERRLGKRGGETIMKVFFKEWYQQG